jgi:Zn-dependent peptidase ImmA (M78 family)/transcriptional regulator with XRE-family HTH domain
MKAGILGFYGVRLRQAREAMGLSITSLAALVGVSKQAISQYELGADAPGPLVFDALRSTLRQDAHFFLRKPADSLESDTCFYRSMAAATKTARIKAQAWHLWVRELIAYILEHVELPPLNFPSLSSVPSEPNMLSMDQIDILAGEVRDFWKLGDGPIPNLVNVAENSGALILRHSFDAETLDALSQWLRPEGFPLIVLNADKNIGVRSRLDLAHELGHMILHRLIVPSQLRRPEVFKLIEDQAFRFGAALLLPEHSFLEDLYSLSLDGLLAQKLKWKVSVAMMIERLRRLGTVTDDQYRRLRINYSARQWNKTEPYDDEIMVEQPGLVLQALRLMAQENIQTLDQMSATTGFSRQWLEVLLNLPQDLGSANLQPKVLEFKRRA